MVSGTDVSRTVVSAVFFAGVPQPENADAATNVIITADRIVFAFILKTPNSLISVSETIILLYRKKDYKSSNRFFMNAASVELFNRQLIISLTALNRLIW